VGFERLVVEYLHLGAWADATGFENAPGEYPVRNFRDEEELAAYLEGQRAAFRVTVGRIRAPRIRLEHAYWPPSERVARRMKQLEKFHMAGRINMSPENLRGVEGTDLRTIWEPIVRGYPAVEYLRRREDGGARNRPRHRAE
jgi:hypothetical protein